MKPIAREEAQLLRVLLATDGSDDARTATTWLRELPLPPEATIRILTVVSLPPSALDIAPVREFHQSLRDGARHEASAARARLAGRGSVEDRVVEGEPREAAPRS